MREMITPLHCACGNGHVEVAIALIKRRVDGRSVHSRELVTEVMI